MVQFVGPPGTKRTPASLTSKPKDWYQPTFRSVMVSRDRLEQPRAYTKPTGCGIYPDDLEVPVRLGGMQPRYAGRVPQEPTRRAPGGSQTEPPASSFLVAPLASRIAP
jgi:hypothetical protein